jgi:hypothetical protein
VSIWSVCERRRPPVPICGTKLALAAMLVTLGYLPHHLLLLSLSLGVTIIYIFRYIYIRIKFVSIHPCIPMSPTTSWGPETPYRHTPPPKRVWAPILNHHECVFPRERHRVSPARVFLEFRSSGERPQYHETLHHVAILELVLDGVCVVWAGLPEESFEVVYRRP